jgi:F-type H+-transporting ATPase subunit delta
VSQKLQQTKIAKRYVNSLFSGLTNNKESDKAAKDIADLGAMIAGSKDLQLFIESPLLSKSDQISGIQKLAEKAKFTTPVTNMLIVMAENRRLHILPTLVHETQNYMAEQSGIIPVSISTARELSAAESKKIQTQIKAVIGRDVLVQTFVDESLIGGLVVQVESTLIDGSLKTKLDNLERELTSGNKAA